MHFTANIEGPDRLGLRELCQRFCNQQWHENGMTPEQTAENLLDQFKQSVLDDLNRLTVEGWDGNSIDNKSDA